MLPAASYLAGAASGSVPAPTTTAAMKASGAIVEVEPSNHPVTPQRTTCKSKANASPIPWVPCCTTIPPSPPVFEPEANRIKRSATSKLVVFWKEAVPNTVKLRLTVKSCVIITSSGKPGGRDYLINYLIRSGFSFDLSDHLENPEHHPRVMGCDTLTPKDIRLSNIHQTTNPLIARPLSEKS